MSFSSSALMASSSVNEMAATANAGATGGGSHAFSNSAAAGAAIDLSHDEKNLNAAANGFQPELVSLDLFPDIMQHYNSDQCRLMIEHLAQARNFVALNRAGPLGGYTALHWMCIKNELALVDYLIVSCMSDVNARANLAETPIFICVKWAHSLKLNWIIYVYI